MTTLNCQCGNQAQQSTVKKEGANQGRPFATCASRQCKFFQWLDEDKKPASSSSFAKTPFSPNSKSSTSNNNSSSSSSSATKGKCTHGSPAILLRVKKEGANQGRLFWSCAHDRSEACKYFEWFSGNENDVQHLVNVNPLKQQDNSEEKKRKRSENEEETVGGETEVNEQSEEPEQKKVKETTLLDHLSDESWKTRLQSEFSKPYFKGLEKFLTKEYKEKPNKIFPKMEEVFTALNTCPFDNVKVVIIGQDPYPDYYAHGMSFSVKKGTAVPKSLLNIYKELANDDDLRIPFTAPKHGYLMGWAEQGVLLINAVMTVEKGQPNAHKAKGWETFTDAIIEKLKGKKNVVYMLWGKDSQKKGAKIDRRNNLVIECAHPSPLAADKGFFGSKCFSKCNTYLEKQGSEPIDWNNLP